MEASKEQDGNLEKIKEDLYRQSGIEDLVKEMVYQKKTVPGIGIGFGNRTSKEMIYAGNREEVIKENGERKEEIHPMDYDSIFDLDQVSRFYTDIIIMKLIGDKMIQLTNPVSKFDKRFTHLGNLTLYDLLTNSRIILNPHINNHSSPNDIENAIYEGLITRNFNNNKHVDLSPIVLRYIAQLVTRCSLSDLIKYYIINPLSLRETYTNIDNVNKNRLVSNRYEGVYGKDGYYELENDYHYYDSIANALGSQNLVGHSGLFSNVYNMSTLGQTLISDDKFSNLHVLGYERPNRTIYDKLSGKSNQVKSKVGTVFSYHPEDNVFLFIGSNKAHNRVTHVDKHYADLIKTDEEGVRTIEIPDGREIIVSNDFGIERDALMKAIYQLVMQYNFIDEMYQNTDSNKYNVRVRKI